MQRNAVGPVLGGDDGVGPNLVASGVHGAKILELSLAEFDDVLGSIVIGDGIVAEISEEYKSIRTLAARQRITVSADQHRGSVGRHNGHVSGPTVEDGRMAARAGNGRARRAAEIGAASGHDIHGQGAVGGSAQACDGRVSEHVLDDAARR